MPDFGHRQLATIPDLIAPTGAAADGWDFADATVISLTFELTKEQALPLLPTSLIRPVPAYAKLLVIDGTGPLGPYREASLLLGARDGVQIRNVLIDSIVHEGRGLEAARAAFAGQRRAGEVALDISTERIAVTISDDGGPLCTTSMGALRRCDATMLKFDALLVPGLAAGEPSLLRYGVRVPLTDVEGVLSRDWSVTMARRESPWHALTPAHNVTAFMSRGAARIEAAHAPDASPVR